MFKNLKGSLRSPVNSNGRLTHWKHVAQHRAGPSSFDRVTCSIVGGFNEWVFTITHVVSVRDIKNQAGDWYAIVSPYALAQSSSPRDHLLNLRTERTSDHWTIFVKLKRTAVGIVPFQMLIEVIGTIADVDKGGINLLSLQVCVVRQ